MLGASEGSPRIDFLLQDGHDLTLAVNTIGKEGGEILAVGTHKEKWEQDRVCYLHLRSNNPDHLADVLKEKGYTVLGMHV